MMNTTALVSFMDTSREKKRLQSERKMRRTKLSFERDDSRNKYIDFTNLSKTQQMRDVKHTIRDRRNSWKHDSYRVKSSFSVIQQQQMQGFPHNNTKYNTQFLSKNLRGDDLKHPTKELGYFPKSSRSVYSKHYQPILNQKIKYNEDYEMRPSMFGDIELDVKRQRVMDMYRLQANPFSTKKSNGLLVSLKKTK